MRDIIVGIIVPLIVAAIVNVIMVLCVIGCCILQKYNPARALGRKVVRFREPQSRRSLNTQSVRQSTIELAESMEYGLNNIEDTKVKRQSTVSQQNEAYGMISADLNRDKTIKQDNMAYGMTEKMSRKKPDTGQDGDPEYDYVHMRFQK